MSSDERTPLAPKKKTRTMYGYFFGETEANDIVKKHAIDEKTKTGNEIIDEFTRLNFSQVKEYFEDTSIWIKILCYLAGLSMIYFGLTNMSISWNPIDAFVDIMDIYIVCFGCIACHLELSFLPEQWSKIIREDAKFFFNPKGKAATYVFWGLLLMSQYQSSSYPRAGFFIFLLGCLIAYVSVQAEKSIHQLKGVQHDDNELAKLFKSKSQGRETLTKKELVDLVRQLNSTMSERELETALSIIETDHHGGITLQKFLAWYHI